MTDRPAIKALEWVDYRDSEGSAPRWKAVHQFGEYRVILNLRDMEYWSPQLGGLGVYWNTLEAAQEAAQSDYESRIRSCLIDKPEAGEVVAVPEGWQLVPKEPTDRMISAGIIAYDGKCETSYRAMLKEAEGIAP